MVFAKAKRERNDLIVKAAMGFINSGKSWSYYDVANKVREAGYECSHVTAQNILNKNHIYSPQDKRK